MPAQSVQNNQSQKAGFTNGIIDGAKRAATGVAVGAAIGTAAGMAMPVSKAKIAEQIVDEFQKTDKQYIENIAIRSKIQSQEYLKGVIENIQKNSKDTIDTWSQKSIYRDLGTRGVDLSALGEINLKELKKNDFINLLAKLKDSALENMKLGDFSQKIEESEKNFGKKALSMVGNFLKKSRADRKVENEANTMVKFAKKAAKEAQRHRITGITIAAGLIASLTAGIHLFSGKKQAGPSAPNASAAPASTTKV